MRENHRSIVLMATVATIGLLTCLGCGSNRDEVPGLKGTVSGKVLYQGKPVPAGSTVNVFHQTNRGLVGAAVVNDSGNYKMMFDGKDQIPVGLYNVAVASPYIQLSPEEMEEIMKNPDAPRKTVPPVIPFKFAEIGDASPKYEVKEGANTFDIILTN